MMVEVAWIWSLQICMSLCIFLSGLAIVELKEGQTQNAVFANALLAVFPGRRSPGG